MPELAVSKLVKPTGRLHREVPPHILVGPEGQLLNRPAVRFKSLVRVLSSDPARQTVTVGPGRVLGRVKVNGVHAEG